jgi:hypothetical protein
VLVAGHKSILKNGEKLSGAVKGGLNQPGPALQYASAVVGRQTVEKCLRSIIVTPLRFSVDGSAANVIEVLVYLAIQSKVWSKPSST